MITRYASPVADALRNTGERAKRIATMLKGFQTREAGAVLNRTNKDMLRLAMSTILNVLKSAGVDLTQADDSDPASGDGDDDPAADKDAKSDAKPAKAREAAGFSVADLANLLQAALNATRDQATDGEGYRLPLRIIDIFDDYVVYCIGWSDTGFYKAAYAVQEDGTVTLTTPVLVNRKVTYIEPAISISASESASGDTDAPIEGAFIRLVERAIGSDGTTRIKIIKPGIGSSGYYPVEVLKRDGARAFPRGTKMFIDHDTAAEEAARPEGTITRLAAVTTEDAQYLDDPKHGPGLYAKATVKQAHRESLNDLAKDIGVSIRADGRRKMQEVNGVLMPVITEIKAANGVNNRIDFVTAAGAGGEVLALFESLRRRDPASTTGDDEMTADEIAAIVKETVTTVIAGELAPLKQEVARLREGASLREAEQHVSSVLSGTKYSTLPAVTRERIAPEIARSFTLTEAGAIDTAALNAAIETRTQEEARYISQLSGRAIRLGESRPADDADRDGDGNNNDRDDGDDPMLAGIFGSWGLSESAAKIAARGRI